jgi:hypothetical protein
VAAHILVTPRFDTLLRFRLPKLDAAQVHAHEGETPVISPDGRFVLLADKQATTLFDTRTWSGKAVEGPQPSAGLGFDPTSSFATIGRAVWDVRSSKRVATLGSRQN